VAVELQTPTEAVATAVLQAEEEVPSITTITKQWQTTRVQDAHQHQDRTQTTATTRMSHVRTTARQEGRINRQTDQISQLKDRISLQQDRISQQTDSHRKIRTTLLPTAIVSHVQARNTLDRSVRTRQLREPTATPVSETATAALREAPLQHREATAVHLVAAAASTPAHAVVALAAVSAQVAAEAVSAAAEDNFINFKTL
jgi:hypothetical protein